MPASRRRRAVRVPHETSWCRHRDAITRGALWICFVTLLAAGRALGAPDWEKVQPSDFAGTAAPFDADAGAEILFRKVSIEHELTTDGPIAHRDHYVRVRVYSEAAAQEQALVRLSTSVLGGRIWDVRGRTVLPDGTELALSAKSVSDAVVARWRGNRVRRVSFAMPGVRPGCIFEYRYRESDAAWFEEIALQEELPARWLEYRLRPLRADGLKLQVTTFLTAAGLGKRDPDGFYPVIAKNVPGFREERHMPPARQLRPRLLAYYTMEAKTTPARYWRGMGQKLAKEFAAWSRANDDLRQLSKEITAGARTDRERLQSLAEWCRREIRVVRSNHPDSLRVHHVRTNFDARETLKQRAGTRMDLDYLFGALARTAGFEVRLLRVPMRDGLPFDQECMEIGMLPSFEIAVHLDSRWECFDPQEMSLPWDMVPAREEGQLALFCDPESTIFMETPVAPPGSSRRERKAVLTLDQEGVLEGSVDVSLSGHWNASLRDRLEGAADSLATFRELMDWDGDWIELDHVRFEPGGRPSEPMHVSAHVRLPAHAAQAGQRMLLEPSLWWAHREPELTAARRQWPVLFEFAWADHDSIRVRLPEGFTVDAQEAPRPVVATGVGSFRAGISAATPGLLDYERTFEMGQGGILLFGLESYPELKRMFEMIHDRDRSTVTLSPTARVR